MTTRARAGWGTGALVVAAAALAAACEDPPPVVLEAGVVGDTAVEQGPYEVRALASDEDGIGVATLAWSVAGPLTTANKGSVSLSHDGLEPAASGIDATRLSGLIPGEPLGSEVRWSLVVCDTGGRCTPSPGNGGTYHFLVGAVPSSPALASIDPAHGPSSGGTRVELRGGDLRPGVKVRFGDSAAASVEWLREDLVVAVTAPAPPGVVDVVVENPDGKTAVLAGAFTFTPSPAVASVDPPSGPEAGGTAVVIRGSGFVDGSRGFFDGVPCRDQRIVDDGELDCATPPGHAGAVDVVVRAPDGGKGVLAGGFSYVAAPFVDGVDPGEGSSDGGDVVSIVGSGFVDGAVVTVGGAECLVTVVSLDGSEITCTTPPGVPGAADVTVTNPDGQTDTLPGAFGFLGPPVVVEVVPGEVPVAGGVSVRVLGAGLHDTDTVTFGGAAGVVTAAVGNEELDVTVPPVPAALDPAPPSGFLAVDVVVTRHQPNDERTGALPAGLVYFWPPEVDAVAPGQGPTAGGTAVVVTGRFFREVAGQPLAVTFDGAACTDVQLVSSTTLTCVTPAGDPGPADVSVASEADSVGTAAAAFFYVAPPRVVSVDPPQGPTFGGDVVTVHGDFFQPGALVFIDGAPCAGATFVDAHTLTCTTPPGDEGSADVRVLNPDGQDGAGAGIYTYLGVAVTPDHGLSVGFTRVSVRSAGMHQDAVITFGGVAADCSFVSSREFSCQSPAHARGDVDVRFENGDGTGETGTRAFHYRGYVEHTADFPFAGENANDVDVADFDGDGDLDAVVSNGNVIFTFGGTQELPQAAGVWENDGHGHFTRHDIGVFTVANSGAVADLDGDGRPDILFSATNGTGPVLVENDGDFAFHQVDLGLDFRDDAFDAELVDVVGDGRKDIYNLSAGCDPNDPSAGAGCDPSVIGPDALLETIDGGFRDRSSLVPHDNGWVHDHKLIAADIDLDGDDDIVIVTNNTTFPTEQNRVMRNRVNEGQGFTAELPPGLLNIFGDLYDLDAGDVDGDGDPDIVTTVCAGDFGEVLLRNENGTLTRDAAAFPGLTQSCTVGSALVDLDDDGDLDILFGGTRSLNDTHTQMRVFINRGDGTFVDGSAALPALAGHLQINNFAAGDLDGDHDVDILIAGGAPYEEPERNGAVVVLHLE